MDGGGGRRAVWRVGGRLLGCLTLLCGLALAAGSGTASAVYDHGAVTGEYGKTGPASSGLGNGCYIVYQQASDRLYLFADSKVYVLDRTGPGSVSPLGGAFPVDTGVSSWCGDPHIAVDNTAGATAGNFYVVPSDHSIYGFGAAGAALSPPWPVDVGAETCGVAVTNTGEVWAGNYGDKEATKFSAAGALLGSIPIGHPICKIAIDQTNNDLYALGYGTNVITKYSAASGYAASMTYGPVNSGNAGFAVNGALDRLYVPGATLQAFDTNTGALVETTAIDGFAGSVAVDESNDTLFVSDIAHEVIKELAWGPAPEVTTGAPSFIGLETVANGHVNPADLITVTDCHFPIRLSVGLRGTGIPIRQSGPLHARHSVFEPHAGRGKPSRAQGRRCLPLSPGRRERSGGAGRGRSGGRHQDPPKGRDRGSDGSPPDRSHRQRGGQRRWVRRSDRLPVRNRR